MTQKSCLSIPVGEEYIVALEAMQEPRRIPSAEGSAWESESVLKKATARHLSNTSDYVVIASPDGTVSPRTQPEVSPDTHIAEPSHGGPKLESNLDDGSTAECGIEQCVKHWSKPIDEKAKGEATREQRLARVEEQLARAEGGRPGVTRIIESPPLSQEVVPELRRMTWLEFTSRDSSQTRLPAIEVLIGGACPPGFKDTNAGQRAMIDKVEPSAERMAPKGSGSYNKAADRIRINSKSVLLILAEVLKQEPAVESLVILHPFKVLVYYEKEIKSILRRLEDKWSTVDREELSTHAPSSVERDSASSTSWMAKAALAPVQLIEPLDIAGSSGRTCSDATLKGNGQAQRDDYATSPEMTRANDAVNIDQLSRSAHETTPYDDANSLEALRDLRCLVRFMEHDVKPLSDRFIRGNCFKVRFEDLWYLFKPGDDVVAPFDGERDRDLRKSSDIDKRTYLDTTTPEITRRTFGRAWRVVHLGRGRQKLCFCNEDDGLWLPPSPLEPFMLQCCYVDYNGTRYGPVLRSFEIRPFQGERDITSLEVFPLRFVEDADELKTKLKERGKLFCDLANTSQARYYNGKTSEIPGEWLSVQLEGPVVVDFAEILQRIPNLSPSFADQCSCDVIRFPFRRRQSNYHGRHGFPDGDVIQVDDIIDTQRKEDLLSGDPIAGSNRPFSRHGTLPDSLLLLLPARVFAYYLPTHAFVSLRIEDLYPLKPRREGFDSLVLPSDHKRTIQALVNSHLNCNKSDTLRLARPRQHDIIHTKGPSILLYGEPGVGKTATADCVAELYGKPLLRINSTTSNLDLIQWRALVYLAEKWDLIILLDDVEVLLKSATDRGIQESVCLWLLETYKGILFLTTNRDVRSLPNAFLSRVQVSLWYPPLDCTQIHHIFMKNIERTEAGTRKRKPMVVDRQSVTQFVLVQCTLPSWNGRRIRDAFESAITFAEYDAEETTDEYKSLEPAGEFVPAVPILKGEHFTRIGEHTILSPADPVKVADSTAERDMLFDHGVPEVFNTSNRPTYQPRYPPPPPGFPSPTPCAYPPGTQQFGHIELEQPPAHPGCPCSDRTLFPHGTRQFAQPKLNQPPAHPVCPWSGPPLYRYGMRQHASAGLNQPIAHHDCPWSSHPPGTQHFPHQCPYKPPPPHLPPLGYANHPHPLPPPFPNPYLIHQHPQQFQHMNPHPHAQHSFPYQHHRSPYGNPDFIEKPYPPPPHPAEFPRWRSRHQSPPPSLYQINDIDEMLSSPSPPPPSPPPHPVHKPYKAPKQQGTPRCHRSPPPPRPPQQQPRSIYHDADIIEMTSPPASPPPPSPISHPAREPYDTPKQKGRPRRHRSPPPPLPQQHWRSTYHDEVIVEDLPSPSPSPRPAHELHKASRWSVRHEPPSAPLFPPLAYPPQELDEASRQHRRRGLRFEQVASREGVERGRGGAERIVIVDGSEDAEGADLVDD